MTALVPVQLFAPAAMGLALWALGLPAEAARRLGALAAAALLVSAVVLAVGASEGLITTYAFGGWRPPFGVVFVVDRLSALFVVLQALLVLVTVLLLAPERHGPATVSRALPLVFLLSFALTGVFLTGDLFNLFVMFEMALVVSYALQQVPGSARARRVSFALVVVNLLASLFFFVGVGLLYASAGSVNLAHLSVHLPGGHPGLQRIAFGMLLLAFGVKAAFVPLLFWLPATYPLLAGPVAALFAGTMTKIGIYALLRTVPLLMAGTSVPSVLVAVGAASALLGVLAAFAQTRMRRLLGYHVVSQVGYMAVAVGLMTGPALAAGLYFTAHNILVKSALFYVADELEVAGGGPELGRSGVADAALAGCFLLAAGSIAGIPPLSGFFGKIAIFAAALDASAWGALGLLAAAAFFTLASMVKIWQQAFLSRGERPVVARARWPLVLLVAATLAMAVFSGPLHRYVDAAARQLLDPTAYVTAVASTPGRPAPGDVWEAR